MWVSYYIKTSTKLSKYQQHTTFNRRCRERHVLPKYLRVKPLVRTSEGHRITHNGSRHFLGACIQECYRKICHLEKDLYYQRRQLELSLQPDHFQELECQRTHISDRENQKFKSTQIRKFDNLIDHNQDRRRESLSSQWVMNLASKPLAQPQQSVLARGLNFAVTTKHIPVPRIAASVDALKKACLPEDVADRAHTQIIGTLSKARTTATNLHPSEFKALRELRSGNSLMIQLTKAAPL